MIIIIYLITITGFIQNTVCPCSHYNDRISSPVGACPLAGILEGPQELVKSHNESFPLRFVVLKRTVSPAHLEEIQLQSEKQLPHHYHYIFG